MKSSINASKMCTKDNQALKYFSHVVDFQEHNNNVIQRTVLPRTESRYRDQLVLFNTFLKLHPQAISPPDIQTCRAFMEWIGRGKHGRIEEKPTVETMLGFFREFATTLKRERIIELSSSTRTTINKFIFGELKRKIGLSTKSMDKDGGVSPNDLTILMTQLWCRDHHEYRGHPPDRARVQLSAAMLLYCFTTARTGEVHESTARRHKAHQSGNKNDGNLEARVMAACYKHFLLTIEIVDGTVMLVLTYEREFVKGFWRKQKWSIPTHAFYEVYVQDVPIFLNLLTFFLPMATADQAFENYGSVIEILGAVERHGNVSHSGSRILEVIRVREDMNEVPVFRQYLEHNVGDYRGNARGADSFGKSLVSLGHRSGYSLNITVRACRRWALQEADKKHSESTRMKFAGHINRDTYGKAYAHPLSEIDGPANYLGIASPQEHIQNRRGMGLYHNSSSPQLLPAKAEYEFLARDDISELDNLLAKLSTQLATAGPEERRKIQLEQKNLYSQKRFLYNEELQRARQRSEGQHGSLFTESMFHYRKRVMPHRDFLAATLPCKIGLRSSNGTKALQALESLCSETERISYRNSLSPIDNACPCGKRMDELQDHRKWLHLYRCYSKQYRLNHRFAEMCFECDLWFTCKHDWEIHCQEHLDNASELLRCDPLIFRNAPIKAGLCPFCLGSEFAPPSTRMRQFILSPPQWHSHIEAHLDAVKLDFNCKHPACSTNFQSLDQLTHHLIDVHCWHPRRNQTGKRKRSIEE
ncbi:Zinc finger C2H2 [Penicillium malachiteum]|uniref:Zinc finger C2H2 n=1 Tax=Penicillium malachiteum TaxID=1324776 RepID=A0AAD6HY15_9EURO|nr:Zinc finger C2H2 [Penicillium malachiteum]